MESTARPVETDDVPVLVEGGSSSGNRVREEKAPVGFDSTGVSAKLTVVESSLTVVNPTLTRVRSSFTTVRMNLTVVRLSFTTVNFVLTGVRLS